MVRKTPFVSLVATQGVVNTATLVATFGEAVAVNIWRALQ